MLYIHTRIREEIAAERAREFYFAGYDKATSAIVDGNVTTLIAAIVLYIFGTGPVKGFATTLAGVTCFNIYSNFVMLKCYYEAFFITLVLMAY